MVCQLWFQVSAKFKVHVIYCSLTLKPLQQLKAASEVKHSPSHKHDLNAFNVAST